MDPLYHFFFEQYDEYPDYLILLEIIAVLLGVASVWFAKKNNIWVYPTGMVSTAIFVFILWKFDLLGDMLINAYYFVMSAYGWHIWTRRIDAEHFTPMSRTTNNEQRLGIIIFTATLLFVYLVYEGFDKWNGWPAYADTFTTGIFFVAMWLMAKRKWEHWGLWIVGDLISIPLYLYKGLTFTALQYLVFLIIAIYGYRAWKQNLHKDLATV